MSDDLRTAFGPLAARAEALAEALAGAAPLDRISLAGHVVAAEIGAFESERGATQRLRFDIVAEVEPPGDAGDDVDRILSYDRLAEAVAAELAAERLSLLETLADRVAGRILREPQARRVFLRVAKLDRGPGELGVEVVRSRGGEPVEGPGVERLLAEVVLAGCDVDVAALLDRATEAPLLICVEARPDLRPSALDPAAQRRIDLLALDQAAWAAASRDPRLAVVATRTEIDWSLRRSRPCLWAPSRLALDAPGAPKDADAGALAAWIAGEIGAVALLVAGTARPRPEDVPAGLEVKGLAPT